MEDSLAVIGIFMHGMYGIEGQPTRGSIPKIPDIEDLKLYRYTYAPIGCPNIYSQDMKDAIKMELRGDINTYFTTLPETRQPTTSKDINNALLRYIQTNVPTYDAGRTAVERAIIYYKSQMEKGVIYTPEFDETVRSMVSTRSHKIGDKTNFNGPLGAHFNMMHELYPQDFGKIASDEINPNFLKLDKVLQTDQNTGDEYHDIELLYQSNPRSIIPTGTVFVKDIPFFRSRRRIKTINGKQIIEFNLSDILKYLHEVGYKSIIIIDFSCSELDNHEGESDRAIVSRSTKAGRRKFRKSRRINAKRPKKRQRRSYRRSRRYILH